MKCLVIGGHGFIGSHFCKALPNDSYDVFDIGTPNGNPSAEVLQKRKEGVNESLKEIPRDKHYDYVVHFGSLAGIRTNNNPNDYFSNNVYALQNFLANHKNFNKLIYISSSSVLADVETPYSLSKKICEKVVQNISGSLVIRPFTVYGQYGRPEMFITKCLSGEKLKVYGDPEKIKRKFTYVQDLVRCILLSMDFTGVINVPGDVEYTLKDVLDMCRPAYEVVEADPRDFKEQILPLNEAYYICKTRIEDVINKLRSCN